MSISTAKRKPTYKQADFTLRAKTALLHHGLTVTQLARRLGLARNSVSIAINHPTILPGVRARICAELGISQN